MEPTTLRHVAPAALHMKKILVPVDFSAPSQAALDFARRIARFFGSEIILLHVVQKAAVAPFPEVAPGLDYTAEDFDLAEKNLQALAVAKKANGSKSIRTVVRIGHAAHAIVEAAKEFDSDLIVIATHGYTGWKHFCIGSTTERVVRTAPCPVLAVREKEHELN